jgi:hypothetical protein
VDARCGRDARDGPSVIRYPPAFARGAAAGATSTTAPPWGDESVTVLQRGATSPDREDVTILGLGQPPAAFPAAFPRGRAGLLAVPVLVAGAAVLAALLSAPALPSPGLLVAVAGLALLGTTVGAVIGPAVVEIMFPGADLGARTMGLLAAGAGIYMLAMACAQALIALGGHADQALGWFLGLATLLPTVWLVSDDLFLRVEVGLLVGSAVAFLAMAVMLARRLATAGPLRVDSGDLLDATHDVPLEA